MISRLTPGEVRVARGVGRARCEIGVNDKYGMKNTPEEKLEIDILGAAAEMAVAKFLNSYWHPTIGAPEPDEADVGIVIQVRHSPLERCCLIVRPGDPDYHDYFLVAGKNPEALDIIGWIAGSEAKQQRWLRSPNGRPPAYFVPQEYLNHPR